MTGASAGLAELTTAHFAPLIGAEFEVDANAAGESLTLKLIEVSQGTSVRENGRPFSIVFEGGRHIPLEQGVYPISHPEVGSIDLFLVPIEQDEASRRYEALFN